MERKKSSHEPRDSARRLQVGAGREHSEQLTQSIETVVYQSVSHDSLRLLCVAWSAIGTFDVVVRMSSKQQYSEMEVATHDTLDDA
jgi:hypothetical protein